MLSSALLIQTYLGRKLPFLFSLKLQPTRLLLGKTCDYSRERRWLEAIITLACTELQTDDTSSEHERQTKIWFGRKASISELDKNRHWRCDAQCDDEQSSVVVDLKTNYTNINTIIEGKISVQRLQKFTRNSILIVKEVKFYVLITTELSFSIFEGDLSGLR